MFDIAENTLGLRLVHKDAIASGEVLRIDIPIAFAGLCRDRYHVTHEGGHDYIGSRMRTRHFNLFLIRTPIPREGMAVALCSTSSEVHVIHQFVSGCSRRRRSAFVRRDSF